MGKLTINEVIEHCERTAGNAETMFREIHNSEDFEKIASKNYWEHKQTAEWLRELERYKDLEKSGRLMILPEGDGKTVLLKALAYSDICPGDCGLKNPPECYDKHCAECWETALKGGSYDNR